MSKDKTTPIVYSTDHGRMCPVCTNPIKECICSKKHASKVGDGIVRVGRETKGRKGKGVTVISGIPLDQSGMADLAKELKSRCGSGGTIKDGNIEIQGDHRDALIAELQKRGWQVKRSGG